MEKPHREQRSVRCNPSLYLPKKLARPVFQGLASFLGCHGLDWQHHFVVLMRQDVAMPYK